MVRQKDKPHPLHMPFATALLQWGLPKMLNSSVTIKPSGSTLNEIAGSGKGSSPLATTTKNRHVTEEQIRHRIPTKKQLVDPYRQGLIIERGVGYRQTVVVRSYEVGPYKTATLESLLNLSSIKSCMDVWTSMLWIWSHTWNYEEQPHMGVRYWNLTHGSEHRDAARLASSKSSHGHHLRTRLSKMPEEVRDEISPWFIEKQAIIEDVPEKIVKLDDNTKYINSDLKPRRSDLDMNHHVNNVKYVRWMLETIPDKFLESHQLSGIVLEYRRECGSSDRVQSLCQPDEDEILTNGVEQSLLKNMVLTSGIVEGNGYLGPLDTTTYGYTHLLQTKGKNQNEEIVRGRTGWRKSSL
ncbi:origin recognition complex subunit 4-like [Hibiscus syriacus]|uniref:Origin recognition complex subunit 4-like n=1 Tax=Hibiscus syriacus TaxID=106335 RepID=A0A6A2Z4F9_HIBSY|nr:origin recognition complex subunit 4-like [Hibiscus syriacus]